MKQTVVLIACCLFCFSCFCQQVFQLAPPLMKFPSVFFDKTVAAELQFREPGAVIHYTLDNTEPNENSERYIKPVIISANKTTLKAKSFSSQYLPSATVEATFIQSGIGIKSANCTQPNEKYTGGGASALIDNKGGNPSASAKTWLGFQNDTVDVELILQKPQQITEVLIDFLQDENNWIFLPAQVMVYAFNDDIKAFEPFNKNVFFFDAPSAGSQCYYSNIEARRSVKSGKLLLRIVPLQHIPEWHIGKGKPAWVFIDEIKVY